MIDLTNKTVATITDCDQEPIHIPGSIQPHGYLLAISREKGIITHASTNVADLFGASLPAILGADISSFIPAGEGSPLSTLLGHPNTQDIRFIVLIRGQRYQCMAHRLPEYLILEVEPAPEDTRDIPLIQTYDLLDVMKLSGTLTDLCQNLAAYFRKTLGYDRIMIYRFDQEDHTGEVIAESLREGLEPYLGLRYPASDIPPQARELYMQNPLRAIADTHYAPAALYTLPDENGVNHQLDLSRAYLRSVSPIHIQYLKNMGVASSLSVAIVRENKLWGLIACHHGSPRFLTPRERDSAHLLGLLLSSQIELHERANMASIALAIENNLNQLSLVFDQPGLTVPEIAAMPELLGIAGANGVALLYEGQAYTQGQTPTVEEIRNLALLLSEYTGHTSYSTKKLTNIYPKAQELTTTAAGVLYEPLSQMDESCLIWFRPGLEQTITWAGQPVDSTQALSSLQKLTPRSSFSAWQETVRHTCAGWSQTHLRAAHHFASLFQKHARLLRLQQEAEKQRALNEKMKAANEELENIHWISMHDLKEPLRKIQALASRVLSQEAQSLTASLMDSINRMHKSAQKMQHLLDDISTYSQITSDNEKSAPVNLYSLANEVIQSRGQDLPSQPVRFELGHLPTILGIHYQLKQLLEQLIGNALKFGKPGQPLAIHIRHTEPSAESIQQLGTLPEHFFAIAVEDNGIGFENELREIIFRLFKRLDNETHGPRGAGIGLAICKKVMLNHDGYIWADSEPGRGSTFYLIFPKAKLL